MSVVHVVSRTTVVGVSSVQVKLFTDGYGGVVDKLAELEDGVPVPGKDVTTRLELLRPGVDTPLVELAGAVVFVLGKGGETVEDPVTASADEVSDTGTVVFPVGNVLEDNGVGVTELGLPVPLVLLADPGRVTGRDVEFDEGYGGELIDRLVGDVTLVALKVVHTKDEETTGVMDVTAVPMLEELGLVPLGVLDSPPGQVEFSVGYGGESVGVNDVGAVPVLSPELVVRLGTELELPEIASVALVSVTDEDVTLPVPPLGPGVAVELKVGYGGELDGSGPVVPVPGNDEENSPLGVVLGVGSDVELFERNGGKGEVRGCDVVSRLLLTGRLDDNAVSEELVTPVPEKVFRLVVLGVG